MQEKIREIKHLFMTYRNGAVADSLRQAGITCYRIVFGLNVPQIAEIARRNEKSMELAEWLWADNGVRESRLLASYLFVQERVDMDYACRLIDELQTTEEADMLCFRLLKYLDFAPMLVEKYEESEQALSRYCSKVLKRHLS